jgi:hypothetical protein
MRSVAAGNPSRRSVNADDRTIEVREDGVVRRRGRVRPPLDRVAREEDGLRHDAVPGALDLRANIDEERPVLDLTRCIPRLQPRQRSAGFGEQLVERHSLAHASSRIDQPDSATRSTESRTFSVPISPEYGFMPHSL